MSPAGPSPGDIHARTQRALVERLAGLLDEAEESRLETHLAGCAACAEVARALQERSADVPSEAGHLPTRLISRWPDEEARLPAVVRDYALRHLRTCEQCRSEFALLGHAPPMGVEARTPAPRVVLGREMRARWAHVWTWWLAGGAAAAAAALLLVFRLEQRTPLIAGSTRPSPSPAPVALPGPAPSDTTMRPAPPREVPHPENEPWLALGGGEDLRDAETLSLDQPTVRGSAPAETSLVYSLSRSVRTLRLLHPEGVLLIENEQAVVHVTVTTPSGHEFTLLEHVRDLRYDRPLVLRLPGGIEAGTYTYVYTVEGGIQREQIRGQIQIRLL